MAQVLHLVLAGILASWGAMLQGCGGGGSASALDGFEEQDHAFCWGTGPPVEGGNNIPGTPESCAAKCKESKECVGFTIVGKKTFEGGNACFLRTGGLEKPVDWQIDCFTPDASDSGFKRNLETECWGNGPDSLRGFNGSNTEDCEFKCREMGANCTGFIRTPSRCGQSHECFFRGPSGLEPLEPSTPRCFYPKGTQFATCHEPQPKCVPLGQKCDPNAPINSCCNDPAGVQMPCQDMGHGPTCISGFIFPALPDSNWV